MIAKLSDRSVGHAKRDSRLQDIRQVQMLGRFGNLLFADIRIVEIAVPLWPYECRAIQFVFCDVA